MIIFPRHIIDTYHLFLQLILIYSTSSHCLLLFIYLFHFQWSHRSLHLYFFKLIPIHHPRPTFSPWLYQSRGIPNRGISSLGPSALAQLYIQSSPVTRPIKSFHIIIMVEQHCCKVYSNGHYTERSLLNPRDLNSEYISILPILL